MNLEPSSTAVVLIEFQNEFTTEGGVFHPAVAPVMAETNMLANTRALADRARKRGATIMHAPIMFAEGYGEISARASGILKGIIDSKAFRKGSWGAAFADSMTPADGDIVVEGKRGLDTFASTNLDFILRSKNIRTVAIGGFLTNCCVESTMRTAYEHGFDVITLVDCVAGTSAEEHRNAIKYDFPMFSRPMPSTEFLSQLGA